MPAYFDTLETRDPELRERALLAALPRQIAHAKAERAGVRAHPRRRRPGHGHDPRGARAAAGHAQVGAARAAEGGPAVRRPRRDALGRTPRPARVFASPGPIYEPEGRRADYWRLARALFAAGFRRGDLVHNCFSYHFTPAGSMLETGAHALGCTVFPGGIGQTEQQVQAMADLQPDGYVGTPSFLKIILEKADELGVALPRLTKALVSGEAFPPSVRDALAARGIAGYQAYATADVGTHRLRDGGARRPGASTKACWSRWCARAPATRWRPARSARSSSRRCSTTDYPLIRFGTGDLSALLPGSEPLRPHQRADQGLDGPRRPDDQGEGHVRAPGAGRRDRRAAIRRSCRRASSSTTRTAATG